MEDLLEIDQPTSDEDQPIEGAEEITEGEQPAGGAEGEKPEGEQKPEVTSLFEPDGKKVAKPIREALTKLKADNPSLGKIVTDAVFRAAELRREFPGGLTEVRELRTKIESLGGLTDIEEKLAAGAELSQVVTQFSNGDPKFVDDLVAESPESFAALAPVVFDKFREVNAEAWSAYIGRIVHSDLQSKQIPLYLMRLGDLVGDKPAAVEILATINNYLAGFQELAGKSTPTKVTPKQPAANQDNQRENDLRGREWNIDRTNIQREVKTEAYTKALAGRAPNTEEKAQIEELFGARAARLADQLFKDWRKVSQGYITRNDKAGYLRYMGSIYRRVIPEAITSAVSSTMKGSKPAAKKPAVNGAAKTTIKAAEGFTVVAKEPDTYQIDYGRTDTSMLRNNQAVLKDGKKVTWR